MKNLLLTTLCLLASCVNFAQDTQPPPDIEGLRNLLLKKNDVLQEPPDHRYIWALFFDIDYDGVPEALVTYNGNDYTGTGGGGHVWYFLRFKDGKWQRGPLQRVEGGVTDPNYVYASRDGFSILTREGQKPTLVAGYSMRGHDGNDNWSFSDDASEITIDEKGYLRATQIRELTVEYSGKRNAEENVIETDYVTPEIKKKLVPIYPEVLYPRQDEDKETPPVATAEAEVQGGEKTSSSQGKFAKQDGVVVEQEKSENKSNPNRLWLYAGILLLVCAVFYVLRRKLKTGN